MANPRKKKCNEKAYFVTHGWGFTVSFSMNNSKESRQSFNIWCILENAFNTDKCCLSMTTTTKPMMMMMMAYLNALRAHTNKFTSFHKYAYLATSHNKSGYSHCTALDCSCSKRRIYEALLDSSNTMFHHYTIWHKSIPFKYSFGWGPYFRCKWSGELGIQIYYYAASSNFDNTFSRPNFYRWA